MKTYLEEAQDLYAQGNRKEAFETYKLLLKVNPDIPEAWYGISLCTDDLNLKGVCLRKAIALKPGYEDAESYLLSLNKSEDQIAENKDKNIESVPDGQEEKEVIECNGKEESIEEARVMTNNENEVHNPRKAPSSELPSNSGVIIANENVAKNSRKYPYVTVTFLSVFLIVFFFLYIISSSVLTGRVNSLTYENTILNSENKILISDYQQLDNKYDELQINYGSLSQELARLKENSLMPPYISTKNREVTIAFTDTNNEVIKWTVPFDTFEQMLDLGFLYRYLSKDKNNLVLTTDSGNRFIVQDMSSYVAPYQFENVMPGLFNSAGSNSEFIEEVWNIVGQLTTYSQEIGETPRFPLETLLAGGGDCEDTAILLASMILAAKQNWVVQLVYMDIDNPTDPQTVNHVIVHVDTGEEAYLIDTTQNEVMQPYKGGVSGWYFDAKK